LPRTDSEPAARERGDAIAHRFRGFLPVIVDVETGGFNPATDALLEVAAVIV
jgi:ribonuclease T